MNVIETGDCIAGMNAMPAGMANLVVADPPYNIGIDYGAGAAADQLPADRYVAWTRAWIAAAARVLSPTGSIVIICGQEFGAQHDLAIQAAGLTIRNRITWYESFGVNCRRKFNRTSRPIFYAVKDPRRYTFNAAGVTVPSARQTKYRDRRAAAGGKLLDDVWAVPRICGTFRERATFIDTMTGERRKYPTQLPHQLVERIVGFASNAGEVVIDPFVGSGTTAAVSAAIGRQFIGFELNPDYAAGARARVAAITIPHPLRINTVSRDHGKP